MSNPGEAEADLNGAFDTAHRLRVDCPKTAHNSPFINCANLIQQNHGIFRCAALACSQNDFGRIERLFELRGYSSDNRHRAVTVSDVILKYQSRPRLPYFRSDHRIKVDEIHFSAPWLDHRALLRSD